ncbi:MAG TPA: hypothetical protein VD886_24530 [Herpetosiphonaceae bacterium]|nr:hypothetical protein [Herpetosiphonaceae bacterium]
MTSLSTGPVRRWRRLAALFAVLLAVASILPAYAVTVSAAGVLNPTFGVVGECNLSSWTATGQTLAFAANIFQVNTCAASVAVSSTEGQGWSHGNSTFGPPPPTTVEVIESTLSQRFTVNEANPQLVFYLLPTTNNPGTSYNAQTVSLYDSAGQLVYSKSRNSTLDDGGTLLSAYQFSRSLAEYSNEEMTLRISVRVQPSVLDSPSNVGLLVDFDPPMGDLGPGQAPIGGW